MSVLNRYTPAILLLLLLTSVSCRDTDGPASHHAVLTDIVTVAATDDPATFSFNPYDDSPLVVLTAPGVSLEQTVRGRRVLMRYMPESGEAYTSGPVKIKSLQAINTGGVQAASLDTLRWDVSPVYLKSMWRSGNYLNLHLKLEWSADPRLFHLAVDVNTLNSERPQLYLVHNLLGAPASYQQEVYSSYDISGVWNLATCRGVDIHINDSNLKKDIYSFNH